MTVAGGNAGNSPPRPDHARWFFVLAWMVVIFLLSNQPDSSELTRQYFGLLNILVRKLAHMTEFAILFFLSRYALTGSFPVKDRQAGQMFSIFALAITVFYAAGDEVHQIYVPGRSGCPADVVFDSLGGLLALTVWQLRRRARS